MLCHFLRNTFEVGVEGCCDVAGLVVTGRRSDLCEVNFDRHGERSDRHKIAFLDSLRQGVLIGKAVEDLTEVLLVAPVGSCRYTEYLCAAEIIKYDLIAARYCVVSLVNDDGVEVIPAELFEPFDSHKSLNTSDGNPVPLPYTALLCLFD